MTDIRLPSRPPARSRISETAGGDAPWLVMVHGASQNHTVFDRQVAAFGDAYRILRIDLPGHGLSTDLPGPYGTLEYAAAVLGAINTAGLSAYDYWGTHTGAIVGLMLACLDPTPFRTLILEGPFDPADPPPSVRTLPPKIAAIARTDGLAAAREAWWRDGRWFDVMRAEPATCRADEHRRMIEAFGGAPWLDDGPAPAPVPEMAGALSDLAVPTLVVNGEHEVPDFLTASDALIAVLPDAHREIIPAAGGFPLWECPEPVNAVVRAFLADRDGPR